MNVFDILRERLQENESYSCSPQYSKGIEDALRIINEVEKQYNNGWIPADNPPKDNKPVLLSFENFTTPLVGRYERYKNCGGAYYIGDETCLSQGIFVNAWQPLKERYKDGE